jgi:hypothetical protein
VLRVGGADGSPIATLCPNGELRRAATIWLCRVGDDICVRVADEVNEAWHGVARMSHRRRIRA